MNTPSFLYLCMSLLAGTTGWAQTVFHSTNLPSQVGQYSRFYYSTNNSGIAGMLTITIETNGIPSPTGQTNSWQYWDFSQSQQSNEFILRTDIVAPTTSPAGGEFPGAAYAERDSFEPSKQIAWRYYGITNSGRFYHGFYNPLDVNADSLVQFDSPTVDLPPSVQFGQTWNRSVTWHGDVLFFPVNYYFTASAQVDAFGTLVLPEIGAVPALRVHEVHSYEVSSPSFGILDLHTNQYYYWLSPGVGVAVQIFQFGNNTIIPSALPYTNLVVRMFDASYFTNAVTPAYPPGDLRIHLQGGTVFLHWDAMTNVSSYRVDTKGFISSTNWQSLSLSTNLSWSDTLTATQRFYRVVGIP